MEVQEAAAALSEVGGEMDMAVVIYYMEPGGAAAVLGSMDVKLAAKITECLLQ